VLLVKMSIARIWRAITVVPMSMVKKVHKRARKEQEVGKKAE
jgi:hypothetical protein